jgi:hypothetical protein
MRIWGIELPTLTQEMLDQVALLSADRENSETKPNTYFPESAEHVTPWENDPATVETQHSSTDQPSQTSDLQQPRETPYANH